MIIAVIPSRFHSSRFPGKALFAIAGEPLVARVAHQVAGRGSVDRLLVATDHGQIAQVVRAAGFEVRQSEAPFRSGSDRVAAAVAGLPGERVINVQGDELIVSQEVLQQALAALVGRELRTVAVPLDPRLHQDPDTVKVLLAPLEGAGEEVPPTEGVARDFFRQAPDGAGPCLAHLSTNSETLRQDQDKEPSWRKSRPRSSSSRGAWSHL